MVKLDMGHRASGKRANTFSNFYNNNNNQVIFPARVLCCYSVGSKTHFWYEVNYTKIKPLNNNHSHTTHPIRTWIFNDKFFCFSFKNKPDQTFYIFTFRMFNSVQCSLFSIRSYFVSISISRISNILSVLVAIFLFFISISIAKLNFRCYYCCLFVHFLP